MKENEELKILARMRSKERLRATRERRKEAKIGRTSVSYKNSRTLGKAVAKVKRNLPASPTKAVEVVKKKKMLRNFKLLPSILLKRCLLNR